MVRIGRLVVAAAAVGAVAVAAHTAVNLLLLRTPRRPTRPIEEHIDVLIPARNEAATIARTVESVLDQQDTPRLRLTVLDDDSQDDTSAIVERIPDPRLSLVRGKEDPPAGWLGKPWACARLGEQAGGSVVAFVDADVQLRPDALASLIHLLRENDLDMVAPYPAQIARTPLARLVQPLVTWSWAALMPVRWGENSSRPSLSAANGQVLVMDARAYREIGGHASVAGEVIEDVALMRAFKVHGFRCATVDGSTIATCTMYETDHEVVDGYAKSLWAAFGGKGQSIAVCTLLATLYVIPPLAMVIGPSRRTRAWGALGYAAGVTSRVLVARRVGERVIPDALAQPASVAAFIALNVVSWRRHARGTNTWKGRSVLPESGA